MQTFFHHSVSSANTVAKFQRTDTTIGAATRASVAPLRSCRILGTITEFRHRIYWPGQVAFIISRRHWIIIASRVFLTIANSVSSNQRQAAKQQDLVHSEKFVWYSSVDTNSLVGIWKQRLRTVFLRTENSSNKKTVQSFQVHAKITWLTKVKI